MIPSTHWQIHAEPAIISQLLEHISASPGLTNPIDARLPYFDKNMQINSSFATSKCGFDIFSERLLSDLE
jgi:hypothetical protein